MFAMVSAEQASFSEIKWTEIRNFLASLYLVGFFACAWASAALLVRALFTSLAVGDDSGWADRGDAADEALFSACTFAAVAGIVLFPWVVCARFFKEWWRGGVGGGYVEKELR